MNRYCKFCEKAYDFKVKSVRDLENLTCPVCGEKIDYTEKGKQQIDNVEQKIGHAYFSLLHFAYSTYILCGGMGVFSFFMHWNLLLYILAIFCGIVFLIHFGILYGGMWLLLGCILGGVIWKSLSGICLGVLLVVLIRQLIRNGIVRLIGWFVQRGKDA